MVSDKFKGKFLALLKQAYEEGKLEFFNEASKLAFKYNFQELIDSVYALKWVVFCRKPLNLQGMSFVILVVILTESRSATLEFSRLTVKL